MSFDAHKNLAYSLVTAPPVPASTGTSLTVAAGTGVLFPVAPFNATIWPANSQPLTTNAEIVRVTAVVGDVLTIVRAQEGTTARAVVVGDQIGNTVTAKVFTDIENNPVFVGSVTVPGRLNISQATQALAIPAGIVASGLGSRPIVVAANDGTSGGTGDPGLFLWVSQASYGPTIQFLRSSGTLAAPTPGGGGSTAAEVAWGFVGGAVADWRAFYISEFGQWKGAPAAETDVLGRVFWGVADGNAAHTANLTFPGAVLLNDGTNTNFFLTNGVNLHQYNVGNPLTTDTPSVNYERVEGTWSANIFSFGPAQGGAGTLRPMVLTGSGLSTAAPFTFTQNGIGATPTDSVILSNSTAAAAGSQQFSPALRLTGQGWKTNAVAASQAVDFRLYLVPVQGAANPAAALFLDYQLNGGGFNTVLQVMQATPTISEVFNTGGFTTGTILAASGAAPPSWLIDIGYTSGNAITLGSNKRVQWVNNPNAQAGTTDLQLTRPLAGVLSVDSTAVGDGLGKLRVGSVSQYNGVATVAGGIPAIYGSGRVTAQVGAAAAFAAYTAGAADGTFFVSANVNVTASVTHSFSVTVTYTDETNTVRVLTLNFSQLTGAFLTAITNVQGVGAYEGIPLHIRCKAATSITFATVGTFTSVTYNAEGYITQLG